LYYKNNYSSKENLLYKKIKEKTMNDSFSQGTNSSYMQGSKIKPVHWILGTNIKNIIDLYEATCFEARNIARAARTLEKIHNEGFTTWLGVAGAGPVGGIGGYFIDLIKHGSIDAICSTGAQVYHDGHFAWDLPVVQGSSKVNDNELRKHGVVRIYDLFVSLEETLIRQDRIFDEFAGTLQDREISSADYCYEWGKYILANAPYPENSWLAASAQYGVPVFLDSESDHSIGMVNASRFLRLNSSVRICPNRSLLEGAAIEYASEKTAFLELGGGGPKNWIQTLAPMLNQLLEVEFEGADVGIQISTAVEKDGGLSGATLGEAVSWEKYVDANSPGLIQIWGEYSPIFPILVGYVLEECKSRSHKRLMDSKTEFYERLIKEARKSRAE